MLLFLAISIPAAAFVFTSANNFFLAPQRKLFGVTDKKNLTLLKYNEYRTLFLSFGLLSSTMITYCVFQTYFNHQVPTEQHQIVLDKIEEENIIVPIISEREPVKPTIAIATAYHNPEKNKHVTTAPVFVDTISTNQVIDTDALTYDNIDSEEISPMTTQAIDTAIYKPFEKDILSNAHFKGGLMEGQRFLQKHLKFPEDLLQQGIEGKVFISLIVNADGSIGQTKVLKGTSYDSFNNEALRIVNKMHNWQPALKKDSSAVRQILILPIDFRVK